MIVFCEFTSVLWPQALLESIEFTFNAFASFVQHRKGCNEIPKKLADITIKKNIHLG